MNVQKWQINSEKQADTTLNQIIQPMYRFESNEDVLNQTEKKERKDPMRREHEITAQERETGHQKRKSLLIEAYHTDSPGPSLSSFCQHHRKGHLP